MGSDRNARGEFIMLLTVKDLLNKEVELFMTYLQAEDELQCLADEYESYIESVCGVMEDNDHMNLYEVLTNAINGSYTVETEYSTYEVVINDEPTITEIYEALKQAYEDKRNGDKFVELVNDKREMFVNFPGLDVNRYEYPALVFEQVGVGITEVFNNDDTVDAINYAVDFLK